MVRPLSFCSNPETLQSNAFQSEALTREQSPQSVQKSALAEFLFFQRKLEDSYIITRQFQENPTQQTPDAIFPNNWFCQLPDGRVFIFPMQSLNRRREVRLDVIESLHPKELIDLRSLENDHAFLEGTGSLIFDHEHRLAYACLSKRTTEKALKKFSELSGYEIIYFAAADECGREIYHTNVMMSLGPDLVILNLSAVQSVSAQDHLLQAIKRSGKKILEINHSQMLNFAGNMLYLLNSRNQGCWIGSERAWNSLNDSQKNLLLKNAEKVSAPLQTIENYGGGGARCMLAEVYPTA